MKSLRRGSLFVLSALLVLSQASSSPAQPEASGRRVLIGFRPSEGPKTANERAEAVRRHGGIVHGAFEMVPVVAAELPEQAIRRLKAQPDVEYVEEDLLLYAIGQVKPWGVDRIDADLAWPTGNTGRGVKVAILDTGIDYDHPDLALAGGINFAGTSVDGSMKRAFWNDKHGHGTHVAGIVAAHNNTIGVVGVAPGASLWAVKVLGDDGSGWTSDIIQGLDWCAANGIRVASMSLGGGSTTSLKNACGRAYARGVVLVAAAGNSGGAVEYPAAYTSVIAVSATDSSNRRAWFSSYGPQIELAAPGVSIYSTYIDGRYAKMSGTSVACPHVAGAAALAWASGLSSQTAVRSRLRSTAEDLGIRGFDTSFGYGLVDAQKAAKSVLTATAAGVSDAQMTEPQDETAFSDTADSPVPSEATVASVRAIEYAIDDSTRGNPDLLITVHVEDDLGNPVPNASVLAGVFVNGQLGWTLSGTTDADGAVTLRADKAAKPGLYETTIADLTAETLTWDTQTPPNEFAE